MVFEYDSEEIAFLGNVLDTVLNGTRESADGSMSLDYAWDLIEEYMKDNPAQYSGGVIV